MLEDNVQAVAKLIDQFGGAMRGSWADIDGRIIQSHMQDLSIALTSDNPIDVKDIRFDLDMSEFGGGHWTDFCGSECEKIYSEEN